MNPYEKIKQDLDIKMLNQRQNILRVLNGQQKVFNAKEIIDAYTDIYNYIIQGEQQGKKMYELFKHYNENFLKESEEIVRKSYGTENFLAEILNQHQIYEYHTRILKNYFIYLDRSLVQASNNFNQYPLLNLQAKQQYYTLFYRKLFNNIKEEFKNKLKQDRIQYDKEVQLLLQRVYKIIYEMKTIPQDKDNRELIQDEIKEESKNYYQLYYSNIKQQSFLDQFKSLVQFKEEELSRIKLVFGQNELQKDLFDIFNQNIIDNYAMDLSQENNDTLKYIIVQDYFQEFSQMVQFFDHFNSNTHILVQKFQNIIIQQGSQINQELQHEIAEQKKKQFQEKEQQYKYLDQLIYLQQSYKSLIFYYAENNKILLSNLNSAFQKITAQVDQYFIMQQLLQGLDSFYKNKLINFEEEKQLSQFIQILECFQEKDLFLKNFYYRLAQRILTQFNYHSDIDKQIIDQFRKTFGPQHTENLASMMKDHEQSIYEANITFNEIEIQARILQKVCWPEIQPYLSLDKILIFQQLKSAFKQKFNSQQEKNKLVDLFWQDQISMIEIQFKTNKDYRVTIGVVCGAILLEFNEKNLPQTIEQLQEKIQVNQQFLVNQINLLEKVKLIIKEGQAYKFNEEFSYKTQKIKLSIVLDQYIEYQQEYVENDRKNALQAAIIRIMKAKRIYSFQQLIISVKEQLKMFKPLEKDIKQGIEILMDQEYLKRNLLNINELIYVS
ncbi:unnamed protein product [Paramecium sonneborni]|uniref:Cullin family profile domain-containing protein n=1 Tax=Paramecium sonneborni TaxID=65129 RepID=A0A8S1N5T5_9CILI|nr:unnamed protein product [Paramecium sonneborni]